jgi:H+-transporting ATPase
MNPITRRLPTVLWSALATKLLATFAAVYGSFMAPIGWQWAGLIWIYCLGWFLINDRVKLAAYSFLERHLPKTQR